MATTKRITSGLCNLISRQADEAKADAAMVALREEDRRALRDAFAGFRPPKSLSSQLAKLSPRSQQAVRVVLAEGYVPAKSLEDAIAELAANVDRGNLSMKAFNTALDRALVFAAERGTAAHVGTLLDHGAMSVDLAASRAAALGRASPIQAFEKRGRLIDWVGVQWHAAANGHFALQVYAEKSAAKARQTGRTHPRVASTDGKVEYREALCLAAGSQRIAVVRALIPRAATTIVSGAGIRLGTKGAWFDVLRHASAAGNWHIVWHAAARLAPRK